MKRYYDFDGIYNAAKTAKCDNIAIAGQKSNGKTYGALHKGLELYLGVKSPEYRGRVIRYARRHKETTKRDNLLSLFKPHKRFIESATNGEYNDYIMRGRRFYLTYREKDKTLKTAHEPFCIVNALSTWENDSGADEGEACMIVFDEAISREHALKDEYDSLMKFRSNCMRDRTDYFCPVVLIGNTVTRDCEILQHFGINLWELTDDKKGKIQYIVNRKNEVNCIFEWCDEVGITGEIRAYYDRFETDKTKMITDGVFELGEYKTLSENNAAIGTDIILTVCFIDQNFKLLARYIQVRKTGDLFIHIIQTKHADDADLYINPTMKICNGNVLNYFDCQAAEIFRELYDTDNILFDTPQTGEMYRSFAQKCIGLHSCVPD